MKKLLKFAGVSALALVTAAPNAFGAAGTFAPSCSSNKVTISFYGMKAPTSGTTPTVTLLGTADYSNGNWYKTGTSTAVTTFGALGVTIPEITKSISLNDISATSGAKPFRADLVGAVPATLSEDTLVGTSVCANSAPANSIGVASTDTLPALDAATISNHTSLAYVVMYAANCVTGVNATCSLEIGQKKATYKNSCKVGYGSPNFNNTTMVCNDMAPSLNMPADPVAPSI